MPQSTPALKPLSADALSPKAPHVCAGLHPASQHSLSARPAPLAAACSENPVHLVSGPLTADASVLKAAAPVLMASQPEEETEVSAVSVPEAMTEDGEASASEEATEVSGPLSVGDVWAELMSSFPSENEEPLCAASGKKKQKVHDESHDFMQNLPTPMPVSLFEEAPAPKKSGWRPAILCTALLAAAAAGVILYLQFFV